MNYLIRFINSNVNLATNDSSSGQEAKEFDPLQEKQENKELKEENKTAPPSESGKNSFSDLLY